MADPVPVKPWYEAEISVESMNQVEEEKSARDDSDFS